MATQVSLAIAKVLQDGKWHPTAYFVARAGYLIRPEGAYRHYFLRKGENISNEKRIVDSRTIEWKITDRKWLQMYLSVVSPVVSPEVSDDPTDKSFDELTDDLWLDFIKNIEHRSAKDSFKEALVATIEWSKQKNGS